MAYSIEDVTEGDYRELVSVWEASVRATHDFLTEEDIQFYKPLILHEYLKAVTLFCVKDAYKKILGFIGIAGRKIEMLFIDRMERPSAYRDTALASKPDVAHSRFSMKAIIKYTSRKVSYYIPPIAGIL
jgi:putative acetyltransferase